MSEPHRIQTANVLFHVINRGNAKQIIFHDVEDHEAYLDLLRRYKAKYAINIYHYVLMQNHVHLLLEPSKDGTISKFMQGVTLGYTKHFNKKYGSVGHVWQARFRSIAIETETYYVRCAVYIELNPVRARLVTDPADYHWSSYQASVLAISCDWLDVHPLLKALQVKQGNELMVYPLLIQDQMQNTIEQRYENFSKYGVYGKKEFLDWYEVHAHPRTETELRPG